MEASLLGATADVPDNDSLGILLVIWHWTEGHHVSTKGHHYVVITHNNGRNEDLFEENAYPSSWVFHIMQIVKSSKYYSTSLAVIK